MIRVGIATIGLVAPGIESWEEGRIMLAQGAAYDPAAEMPPLKPAMLPANERRRTTAYIRLALQAAQDALDAWQGDTEQLATVFSSSGGDLEVVDRILTSINQPGSPVSPTHFHNSVHNASAGYWSIATGSHAPSTSLSAYDASFAAGLLEAATQVCVDGQPVLLVAYDMPPPEVLLPFCPTTAAFGVALLLVPETPGLEPLSWIGMDLQAGDDKGCEGMHDKGLEALRSGVAAGRSLPLLERIARGLSGSLCLPAQPGQVLNLDVAVC
jgi:hypothetical protein